MNGADGWSSDATPCTLAWLDLGRKNRANMRGRRRERGTGRRGCRRIARENRSRRIAGRTEGGVTGKTEEVGSGVVVA